MKKLYSVICKNNQDCEKHILIVSETIAEVEEYVSNTPFYEICALERFPISELVIDGNVIVKDETVYPEYTTTSSYDNLILD